MRRCGRRGSGKGRNAGPAAVRSVALGDLARWHDTRRYPRRFRPLVRLVRSVDQDHLAYRCLSLGIVTDNLDGSTSTSPSSPCDESAGNEEDRWRRGVEMSAVEVRSVSQFIGAFLATFYPI